MEKRFKFRHVNAMNGVLVFGVLALVLAGVIFSGHSQQWFSRKYTFDVLLPVEGALGLSRGSDVFILGVPVGLVNEINVGDDGRMRARVKIRRDFARFVRSDSTASIKKVFEVAGDSFIEITRGTGAILPAHGPEITCSVSEDSFGRMEKMLADLHSTLMPVVRKAGDGLDEWTKLGGDLREECGDNCMSLSRNSTISLRTSNKAKAPPANSSPTPRWRTMRRSSWLGPNETMIEVHGMVTNLDVVVKNLQNGTTRLPEITDAMANEAKDLPGLVGSNTGLDAGTGALNRSPAAELARAQVCQQNKSAANSPDSRNRGNPRANLQTAEISQKFQMKI